MLNNYGFSSKIILSSLLSTKYVLNKRLLGIATITLFAGISFLAATPIYPWGPKATGKSILSNLAPFFLNQFM